MSGGFNNPIVGGGGGLVYPAIKSPNYVPGSAGWSIKKDGSAEFNNVTIRGGNVIDGTSLFYNGAPALGNLIGSTSGTAGTDAEGNAYLAGVVGYVEEAGTFYAAQLMQTGTQGIVFWSAPSAAGPWTPGPNVSPLPGGGLFLSTPGGATTEISGGISVGGGATITDLLTASGGAAVTNGLTADTADVTGALTATGGTASSPTLIETDTVHGLGALGVTNLSITTANYKLMPDGTVMITIIGSATGAVTGGTATFPNALAAAYRPATEKLLPAMYGGTITAGEQRPRLQVNTNGQVTLAFPTLANGNLVSAGGVMDLQ